LTSIQPARLILQADGTPYSDTYDDVYHSAHGGPEQARHVFLGGNNLPERWQNRERFVIFETGFGLGLNFLATWAAWQDNPARCRRLHFLSVEKHPFQVADLARAHAAWPEFAGQATELRRLWPPLVPGMHRLEFGGGHCVLTLIFGDATGKLRQLNAAADAFYLDGFSPARNPELWSREFCRTLARLAAPGATLATWSVAGHLRQSLADAEFDTEKRPGFAGKRQMLTGRYRSRRPARFKIPDERSAVIIGAGLAGSTIAERLAARGWQITLFDHRPAPGQGASGNLAGVLRPQPSIDDNRLAQLSRAGFLATRALLRRLSPAARWQECGVLQLARDAAHAAVQQRTVKMLAPPADYLDFLDRDQASARLGWSLTTGGWWFPGGGWVQPSTLCQAALNTWPQRITVRFATRIASLRHDGRVWQACGPAGDVLAEAPRLIVATGAETGSFAELAHLPLQAARGQVTYLPAGRLPDLPLVVCRQGYVTPAINGWHACGASFCNGDLDDALRQDEHFENLQRLEAMLPGTSRVIDPTSAFDGRVGFRSISPDRLPIVGELPVTPGLYCALGYGARGLVWSALMAELLACQLEGEPPPCERPLADAVSPARFIDPTSSRAVVR